MNGCIWAWAGGLVLFEKGRGRGRGPARGKPDSDRSRRGSPELLVLHRNSQISCHPETRSSGLWTETMVSLQDSILISKWDLIVVTELGTAITPVSPKSFHYQWARRSEPEEIVAISYSLKHKDIVCEVCGVVGYRKLLVQCSNCKNAARHLYCLDPVIYDASSFEWLCDDCPPKHNEVLKSLERNHDHNHQVPRWMGSRNVIEKHNMLFEKDFNKAGVRMFSRPQNMNDVLETRSGTWFHVPGDSSYDDHYSIQLGSIINEPNVYRVEVTNEALSWGCRRHRSHKARKYSTWGCRRRRSQKARRDSSDASTKHFLSADTFNSEMFIVKKLKRNDILEEGKSENDHLIYQPESAYDSSQSASDLTVEIQKTGGAVGPTMNTMECLDLSMEKDSCSLSLNCVEGFTQGAKSDLVPLINDAERSYLFVMGSSCPTVPNMEQEDGVSENAEQPHPLEMVNPDGTSHSPVGPALEVEEQGAEAGLCASVEDVEQTHPILTDKTSLIWSNEEQVDSSSPASESWEQPVPLKVVILRPWHDVPNSILISKLPSNYSQSMQESNLYVGNMDVLDPSKEWVGSRLKLEEQGAEAGLFASVEYVEQTHPKFTDKTSPIWSSEEQVDGSSPTSESWEQPDPLEVVRPWDDVPNSILRSKPPSNYSRPFQGSDLDVGNMDVLDPSNEWMDSRLMSNTVEPSSSSNGGGTCVEKDNTEKAECLSGMDTPGFDNVQGSNPSAEPSSSSNGEGNLAVEIDGAEMTECLLGMGTLTPAMHNAQALNPLPSKQIDRTCSSASLDLSPKTKEVNDANDAEPRCSESVRTFQNGMAKKRKRPILSYDEDAEAMQMEVRMRGRHVKSRAMKRRRSAENSKEAMSPGNSNSQHANDDMKARKQRRANKDKKVPLGNARFPCAQNDAARLASDQQSFIRTQPIDRSFWIGIMKIGQEYISLAAHLSNQACKEVQKLSLSLPAVMKVTKHSKLKAWPGRWKASEPTAECIGLYFFSDNMRELDLLVHYLTDHSLVLKYVVRFAKLLIFPSLFLPEQCQTFQGKHYLWGVFKRRMGTGKQVPQCNRRFVHRAGAK